MANAFDAYIAYKFVRLLTTPFHETDAYKQGIIDDEGNLLKKSDELKTKKEREAYTIFHRLVFNLKRLLAKFPLGQSKMASFSAALYLIKERAENSYQVEKEFWNFLKDEFPELTNPENLNEQFLTEARLRRGRYVLIHDVVDERGNVVEKGTEFRLRSDLESKDVILGNPVYTVEIDRRRVPISTEDIKRIR